MSEIVVETTPTEIVVEIEGGPTLTTTVTQEMQTVIETPADPVVIDLNSGARGEPGSAILTGEAYPTLLMGSIGDLFIVTEGDVGVGDVYTKTSLGWVLSGNIRGPAGGIDSVNGYPGPVVELTKTDIGLDQVDNTADLLKPISTATQAALDLKAIDTEVVHKTGAETIAGVKTFSSSPVVPDSSWTIAKTVNLQTSLDGKVNLIGDQTISDTKTFSKTPILNPPTGPLVHTQITSHNLRMWHDRFRFSSPVYSTSPDGVTWTPVAGGGNALDGRSDTGTSILHTDRYARWYWDNTNDMAYANIARLVARWGYVATIPDVLVTVESSANGTAWTVRGTTTMTSASNQQFAMSLSDNGGDTYYRVTMQVIGGAASGTVAVLHMLELQNYRIGSQGKGFEVEEPFWWNYTREIGLYNHIRVMAATNTIDLGTTGTRFRDGYFAGTLTAGALAGSGAAITALSGTNISTGTVADARLSTNVNLLNAAQTVTGAKTFTGTVIVPAPTADTHASTKKYVDDAITLLANGAPALLNTIDELAQALGDDPNFATTVTNQIATKVGLTGDQTIAGIKTLSSDTYITRLRSNTQIHTQTNNTLGSSVGDAIISRRHTHVGATNEMHLVDMVSRRANTAADWSTTNMYTGIAIDTSFLLSPLAASGSRLRTWIGRDPQNQTISFGSEGTTFLTISATGLVGNGSGLTALNGSNISTGTVADARLSSNVLLLTGAQTITGVKTFSAAPVVPVDSFAMDRIVGLGAALTAKQDALSSNVTMGSTNWNNFISNAVYTVNSMTGANSPAAYPNGTLHVMQTDANTVTQVYYTHASTSGPAAYTRTKLGASDWTAWRPLFDGTMTVVRVVHDGTSWPVRPTHATYVEWVGPVAPGAATSNDTWVNTSV